MGIFWVYFVVCIVWFWCLSSSVLVLYLFSWFWIIFAYVFAIYRFG